MSDFKQKMRDLGHDIKAEADKVGDRIKDGYDDVKDRVEAGFDDMKEKVDEDMGGVRRDADRVGDEIKDSKIVRDTEREARKLEADAELAGTDIKDEFYKIKEEI